MLVQPEQRVVSLQQPALPQSAAPPSLHLEPIPPILVALPLPALPVDAMRSRAYVAEQPLRPRGVAFPPEEPPRWQAPDAAAEQSFSAQAWPHSPQAPLLVSPLPDSPLPDSPELGSPPRASVQAQPVPRAAAA